MDFETCDLLTTLRRDARALLAKSQITGFSQLTLISKLLPTLLTFAQNTTMETLGHAASMSQSEVQASLKLYHERNWPRRAGNWNGRSPDSAALG